MHGGAAQFVGGNLLADGGLHQRRPGEEKSAAVGHEHVIAHHRQVAAARDAHAHDGGDLRNPHGRHHRVVAEHAAEVVGVRENIFLQRQEDSRGIHQVNRRHPVFDRDVLRANHLLRGHGEERARLHGGVVGDDHHQPGLNAGQPRDDAGCGCAAPLFVHAVGGVGAEFEKCSGINQQIDALARREASLAVLALDRFRAAAFADSLFFVAHLRNQVSQEAHVGFKAGRGGIDMRLEYGGTRRRSGINAFVHEGILKEVTV